ncbi:MAG: 1-acyl-sn-glycerol-3-phosphate acyltransferase [Oscillospiraceae bacterium]|nr:1-acyl-sn-glycerol-3-phosphate acyltransferase [Oscillospiraceae bacterium]
MYSFVRFFLSVVLRLVFPFSVVGKEKIKKLKDGFILCSNHISNLDALFLMVIIKRKIAFIAKQELFRGFFGLFLKTLGMIPVQRGNAASSIIGRSEEILKKGEILGIFIEGTRSRTGEFLKPRSGAAVLAFKTKVPVVPVCITPKRKKLIKIFRKTLIYIGDPVFAEDLELQDGSTKELRKTTNLIMEKIKKLRV